MKAVIVGGGIGGLASAVALARRGWQVEVLERAPEFTEVGAGLSVWANGRAGAGRAGRGRVPSGATPRWRARAASRTTGEGGWPAPTGPNWSAGMGRRP